MGVGPNSIRGEIGDNLGKLVCDNLGFKNGFRFIGTESSYKKFMTNEKLYYKAIDDFDTVCSPDFQISAINCKKGETDIDKECI